MLATLAALQLLLAAQTKLAEPADEPVAPQPGAESPAPQTAPEAPEPPPPARPPAAAPQAPAAPAVPAPAAPPDTRATPAEPKLVSLLSAEPLGGSSAALGWVGWPSLGATWGQGLGEKGAWGLQTQLDWASTEFTLGGWYRQTLGDAGAWLVAGRLGAYWFANLEGELVYEENEASRGVQIAPALIVSTRAAGGMFSVTGDLPMTVTFRGDGGFLFAPRATVAYEAPLYGEISVGIRGGIGYRAGAGDAPMPDGRTDLELVLLAGYRVF